ncbi:hypothetical protein SDC9_121694 [bioreactor metagenome]|uniref:Uncharacterized protein n=1 Tax=bioreactor metagenome TaxID=1076179 RepID=A0A645CCQ0_9ZZZZ
MQRFFAAEILADFDKVDQMQVGHGFVSHGKTQKLGGVDTQSIRAWLLEVFSI